MAYTSNGCDAGICRCCGKTTRRSVGCWCYKCYLEIAGLDKVQRKYKEPGREERIALYRSRAERGLPLFED